MMKKDLSRKNTSISTIGRTLEDEPFREHSIMKKPRKEADISQMNFWYLGKNLDLGNGVWTHDNLDDYILEEQINIYPGFVCRNCNINCEEKYGSPYSDNGPHPEIVKLCPDLDQEVETYDFDSNPEALVQGINYEQAKAYYHWKYIQNIWPW